MCRFPAWQRVQRAEGEEEAQVGPQAAQTQVRKVRFVFTHSSYLVTLVETGHKSWSLVVTLPTKLEVKCIMATSHGYWSRVVTG